MPSGQSRRTVRHYRHQFPIIFVGTYAVTFLLFPVAVWFTGRNLPADTEFGPWLKRSYWGALFPALTLFSRVVGIAIVLLAPFIYLTRQVRFTTAVFLFGSAISIFVTAFIAVWISRGLYTDGSAMTSEMHFALTLSLTSALLSLPVGAVVIWLDTKIRSQGPK